MATSDPDELRADIRRLSGERDEVRGRIATLTEQVISLREAEYRHRSVAPGYAGTLPEIVERVHAGVEKFGWVGRLPGTAEDAPPLTSEQAQELLVLLRDGAGEPRAGGALPLPDGFPSPRHIADVPAQNATRRDEGSRCTYRRASLRAPNTVPRTFVPHGTEQGAWRTPQERWIFASEGVRADPQGAVPVPRASHRTKLTRRHGVPAPRARKRGTGVQRCLHLTPSAPLASVDEALPNTLRGLTVSLTLPNRGGPVGAGWPVPWSGAAPATV
ncbi:hypothetical protein GCM10023323_09910 [Streptomyces thinghirensis]|uniref:Uncharacterized protein n=1 Tax=Streptomyces thinghirensis TaxID=551547 RepID=A0ABP9SW06_9ACTN